MPQLPTVQLDGQAPTTKLPDVGVPGAAFVAKGLDNLADGLHIAERLRAKEAEAIKDGEDTVKGTEALTNLAIRSEEAEQYARENADPENHLATWREKMAEAKAETEQAFTGFGRQKQVQFKESLARVMGGAEISVLKGQQERRLDRQVADGKASIDRMVDFATRSQNPELRATFLEQAGSVAGGLARSGSIKETTAQQWLSDAKERVAKGRAAYFATGLKTELDNLQNEALRNPAKAEDLFIRGQKKIKEAGGDWLPAEKVDEVIGDFKNGLWVGTIKTAIDDNPVRAKAELKAGKYDDKLSQQAIISLNAEADAEIARREREAEARRREALSEIGKAVTDFKEARMLGHEWAGNVAQLEAAARGTKHQAEFEFVNRAAESLAQFTKMNPAAQQMELDAARNTPKSGDGAKHYRTLEAAHEMTKAGLKKDPIAFAINQRVVPAGPALNINSAESLQFASKRASMVENNYQVSGVSPLTDDEASKLVADMSKGNADQKAQTMRQLNQNFTPAQIHSVAAQMDKKGQGELAQAFGMSSQVPEVTSRILQGMDAKKANKEVLPTGAAMRDMDAVINKKLADAYRADPNALDAVRDAVKSYYAWGQWSVGDLTAGLNEKRLNQAIYAVSGGVMDFNGSQTLPPRYGVTEPQFRKMVERADFSQVLGAINAKTVLQHGKLTAVGPGLYNVTIGGSPIFNKQEKPFVLDLSKVQVGPDKEITPSSALDVTLGRESMGE